MNFGFAVGDFIAVGQLAFELYRAYASAPGEYRSLSTDLDVFRGVVSQFELDVQIPTSPLNRCNSEQKLQLVMILGRSNSILKGLGNIRDQFQSFQSHPSVWDRLRFPSAKVRVLQANLHLQTSAMKLFYASLTTTDLARIMAILENQDRLYQANWNTLLTMLAERGITEEIAAPYRAPLEEHVQAIHEVTESEREISAQSDQPSNPFRSEHLEGSIVYGYSDSSDDEDGPNNSRNRSHGFVIGPPTEEHLVSRVCPGAVCLQEQRAGGIRVRKNNWLKSDSGNYKYKLECPTCSFIGFQHHSLVSILRPKNTPLFFVPRRRAFEATSLEYHLDVRANHREEVDGIFYRTIFFWKCHVRATSKTRHREGDYECPFCPLRASAGVCYKWRELLDHILAHHVQDQPCAALLRRFNVWVEEDSPALFESEHGKTWGRDYDLLLPRPFSRVEGYHARLAKEEYELKILNAAQSAQQTTGIIYSNN